MFLKFAWWFSGVGCGTALCIAATVYRSSQESPDWDPVPGYMIAIFQAALSLSIPLVSVRFRDLTQEIRESSRKNCSEVMEAK